MTDLLTAEQVADRLQISEKTVYEWAKNRLLPSIKIVSVIRFKKQDIENICKFGLQKPETINNIPKPKPVKRGAERKIGLWEKKREK